MNYMEREQTDSDDFSKLIMKHAGIVRQNLYLIVGLTVLGLIAGIAIQKLATPTYIKEVLLKNGNGLHLSIISDLMQPSTVRMKNQNAASGLSEQSKSAPITNLTIENNPAERIVFGGTPQEFSALNLQIVKRVANSSGTKISVINSLPKDSRLRKKAAQSEEDMTKILKKFRISSLTRGSDEILVRFDGKSIEEAEQVVSAMINLLRQQFTKLEKERIETTFNSKLLVINSQIEARKSALKAALAGSSAQASSANIDEVIRTDADLLVLASEKLKFLAFPVDKVEIEPFIVVPIDLSKKVSFVNSKTWLFITALAGLIFGLFLGYAIYGIRKLKNT